MSAQESLYTVIGILMLLFGLGWALAGQGLGLSRSASLRWMGFCMGCFGAAAVGVLGSGLPPAVESAFRNVCVVAAFILLRQGSLDFLGAPLRHLEHRLLFGLVLLISLAEATGLLPTTVRSSAVAAVLCWLALACGIGCARPIRREFGWIASAAVAGPMFGAAALFGWRAAWAFDLSLHHLGLPASSGIGPVFLLALFSLVMLFNLSLCYLVLTRLTRQLRHLASRDALTNLLNRRAMMEALHAEHRRLLRGGEGCVVLAIDADHFKRVNDTRGHATGDEALRHLARVLETSLRETDTAGRMGGEEFLLLLRMTDLAGAVSAAQRIRAALATQAVGGVTPPLHLTVSIGVAVLPRGSAQPVEEWLRHADVALYRAKERGRDRIEVEAMVEAPRDRAAPAAPAATWSHAPHR